MKSLDLFQLEFIMGLYDTYEWSAITEKFNAKFSTDYKEDNLRISFHRKKEFLPDLKFTRAQFDNDKGKAIVPGHRLLVTGAGPTHVIDDKRVGLVLPEVLKTLQAKAYAEPVILAGIGHAKLGEKQSAYYDVRLKPLKDCMFSSVQLHSKLEAKDYKINPQMINPLSRLYKEGQRHNLIISSPKQHLEVAIVGNDKFPHTIQSTGWITEPAYQNNSIGCIAEANHTRGGIIVESTKDFFLTRKVRINDDGGFYDLDTFVKGGTVSKGHSVECVVLGDAHVEHEDVGLTEMAYQVLETLKPKYCVLHDLMDGVSASPFLKGADRAGIPSIREEADNVIAWLEFLHKASPNTVFVIANSNHHHFLDRWLRDGSYHTDPINHRLGLEMKLAGLDGKSAIEYLIDLPFVRHLGPDEDFFIGDIQVANHGHKGPNGAKGSKANTGRLAYRSITAHTHEPFERDNHTGVGHLSKHRHGYNTGGSGWMVSFAIIQPDYSIQQVIPVKNKFSQWVWRIP